MTHLHRSRPWRLWRLRSGVTAAGNAARIAEMAPARSGTVILVVVGSATTTTMIAMTKALRVTLPKADVSNARRNMTGENDSDEILTHYPRCPTTSMAVFRNGIRRRRASRVVCEDFVR